MKWFTFLKSKLWTGNLMSKFVYLLLLILFRPFEYLFFSVWPSPLLPSQLQLWLLLLINILLQLLLLLLLLSLLSFYSFWSFTDLFTYLIRYSRLSIGHDMLVFLFRLSTTGWANRDPRHRYLSKTDQLTGQLRTDMAPGMKAPCL